MAIQSPFAWRAFEDAIYDWASGATGLSTVWGRQRAPQPIYPFCVLNIVSGPLAPGGSDELRTATNLGRPQGQEIELAAVGLREITVSCQIFQSVPNTHTPEAHAYYFASLAQGSLGMVSVLEAFRARKISVIDHGDVVQFDEVTDSDWIQRANLDVRFGVAFNAKEFVGYIEKVRASSDSLGLVNHEFG